MVEFCTNGGGEIVVSIEIMDVLVLPVSEEAVEVVVAETMVSVVVRLVLVDTSLVVELAE